MGTLRKFLALLVLLVLPRLAQAQISGMTFYNGSTLLGHATTYKADGTTITCTISGATVTCSSAGGIGGTITNPHIPYAVSGSALGDTTATWDNVNDVLALTSNGNSQAAPLTTFSTGGGGHGSGTIAIGGSYDNIIGPAIGTTTSSSLGFFISNQAPLWEILISDNSWSPVGSGNTNIGQASHIVNNVFVNNLTNANGNGVNVIANTSAGASLSVTPGINNGGVQNSLVVTNSASINQTTNTEIPGVNFNLSATRQWSAGGGTQATQREFLIQAPTYAATAGYTITTAATVGVTGRPVAGTNVTITESIPLLVNNNSIGAVSTIAATEGVVLMNSTAAAAGAQQFSPMLVLDGQGWSTTNTASQDVRFGMQTTPVQGAATPSGTWHLMQSINGAAYSDQLTMSTGGTMIVSTQNGVVQAAHYDRSTASVGFGDVTATGPISIGRAGLQNNIALNAGVTAVTMSYAAATSSAHNLLTLTMPADTGQTASTEVNGVLYNFSATRTWATGAIATQREFRVQPPTYAFNAASTITTAATVAIDGDPIAGTNATITESIPLLIMNNGFGTAATFAASEGVSLQNTTAAAAGAQQSSPLLEFCGQGWETGTAASQTACFALQVQPVQGSTNPTAQLNFFQSINGGAYATVGQITSGGSWTIPSTGTLAVSGNAFFTQSMRWGRKTVADVNYTRVSTDGMTIAYTSITAARTITYSSSVGNAAAPEFLIIKDESGNASAGNTISLSGPTLDGVASPNVVVNTASGVHRIYCTGTAACFTW